MYARLKAGMEIFTVVVNIVTAELILSGSADKLRLLDLNDIWLFSVDNRSAFTSMMALTMTWRRECWT